MAAPRRQAPQLSGFIGSKDGYDPFGTTWSEFVGDVRGYCVQTSGDYITEITNLSRRAVAFSDHLVPSEDTYFFILLPSESVRNVEVYHEENVIHGIRFRTNERTSPWLGSCKGKWHAFIAKTGGCITALCGARRGVQLSKPCVAGLAVMHNAQPVAVDDQDQMDESHTPSDLLRVNSSDLTPVAITESSFSLRAVVVTLGSSIRNIRVVSASEYEDLTMYHGSKSTPDHWFVLTARERIEAVGVVVGMASVDRICFRTNLRTSLWFGQKKATGTSDGDQVKWFDCSENPGAWICGFQLEWRQGTNYTGPLSGIGVIYRLPPADTVAKTTTTTKATTKVKSSSDVEPSKAA